jgi:hypothetical protein
MDNIIVGQTDDPNYKSVGHLADGTPVFRYDPLLPKKTLVNEKIIEEYNKSVKIADTETQKLLDKFKWDELKDQEKQQLKDKIKQGYVKVFDDAPTYAEFESKSEWNESVKTVDTDTDKYTEGLKKAEPVEKKVAASKPKKKTKKAVKKKKATKKVKEEPKDQDTSHYTAGFKQDPPKRVQEGEITEQIQPETYSDETLIDSYYTAKEIEQNIESRREEDVSKSIADCYKESSEHPSDDDSEVLGYFDEPGGKKLRSTKDTTEYLSSYDKSEKNKLDKEHARQQRINEANNTDEVEVETPEIFKDNDVTEHSTNTKTSEYLELFNIQEDQDSQQQDEQLRRDKIISEQKEEEDKVKKAKSKKVQKKVDELKEKTKEDKQKLYKLQTKSRTLLEKEYFRNLLEKKYASNELVDKEYNKIKRDLEVQHLKRREVATLYLKQLNELNEQEAGALKLYEKHIAGLADEIKSAYEPLLEQLEQMSAFDGVQEEFDDYNLNVNMSSKSVTVTEKETGKGLSFDYKGSLATYKIDGYRLELYSLSKDPAQMVDPTSSAWFTTHFFLTYDLRTGEVIEHLSHTLTKAAEERELDDEDYTFEDDSWKHSTFEFTTGGGRTFCSNICAAFMTANPPHPVSAIMLDGWVHGYVKLGVKRRGGRGAVTVRYLVKSEKPSFADAADYTIDFDPSQNPSWTGDAGQAFGSGYFNNAEEAYDSEVSLVSSHPGSVPIDGNWHSYAADRSYDLVGGSYVASKVNSVSSRWQTLTWADNDFVDKYIYIRSANLSTSTNYQTALRWFSVYLSFNQSSTYNLIADGVDANNHVRATALGPINASASILPEFEGQVVLEGGRVVRGAESTPFYVAISGWAAGQPTPELCETVYG